MQKTKTTNRVLSLVLALLMVLSLFPAITLNVSAADGDEPANSTMLEPGTYITTLYRLTSCTDSTILKTATEHFSSQAILTINDDLSQTVTIGVEHWSLYEAFVPAKQSSNETGFTVLPAAVFNSENNALTNFQAFYENNSDSVSEEANGWYSYTNNAENKFGDIQVEYNETIDFAYVTFSIDDYTHFFAVQGWFNSPIDGNGSRTIAPTAIQYNDLLVFSLETNFVTKFDMNTDLGSVADTWTFVIRNTSRRRDQPGKGYLNYFTRNMTLMTLGEHRYHDMIDNVALVSNSDGSITAHFHLTDTTDASDFKCVESIANPYVDSETYYNWDYWKIGGFREIEVNDDVFSVTYSSLKDAIFGKNIYCDLTHETNWILAMSLSLSPVSDNIIVRDSATGIYAEFNKFTYPNAANYHMEVMMNQVSSGEDYYYTGLDADTVAEYTGIDTKNPYWYTVVVKDNQGNYVYTDNTDIGALNLYVPLPDDYHNKDYKIQLYSDGVKRTSSANFASSLSSSADYCGDYARFKWINTAANTIVIAENIHPGNVYALTEDGIYSASICFVKKSHDGEFSMADAALKRTENNVETRQAYIYVNDGEKKLYFKFGPVLDNGEEKAYAGDLICNNINVENEVYWESVSYTDFALDADNNLLDNLSYDAVTEWACVTGGILTLMDECYLSNNNVYELVIAAPAMAEAGGETYEGFQSDPDSLCVWLKCYDLNKTDMTLNDIKSEGYGYHASALLRKIRLAETYINSGDYTTESVNNLKAAVDVAYPVYETDFKDNLAAASDAYEEQINLVQASIDALVLDESAIGDKTELQALVDTAKAMDTAAYTDSSVAALTDAITAAQAVLDKDGAKQTKIDEAKEALQAAIDALVEKEITDYSKNNLPDGEYTLYATMQKAGQPETYSMSNNAIDHNVKLTVATVNGEKQYTLTVDFNGMTIKLGGTAFFGYLKDLSYYDQGYTYNNYGMPVGVRKAVTIETYQTDANGAKIVDDFGTDYPDIMSFPLVPQAINDDYVPLHVFVPIMESISTGSGDQEVLMKLDWSSLKKAETDPCADGHKTEVKNAKAATCTEAGYTGDEVCSVCGETVKQGETIAAKGHTWGEWKVTKAATTSAEGEQKRTCSVCGETETRSIPKLDVKNPFVDVVSGQYYYDPVLWAVNHDPQITNGTDATHFSPMTTCTRGQVVTFLWRAKGCPEPKNTNNPFTDVKASDYYYKAVLWANENGITNGTSATTFSPMDPCTRAHVVTFLWRAENKPAAGSSNPFVDVPDGLYFTDAVLWAVNHAPQITNGTDATHFSPDKPCTRGQVVTFLYRDMA